MLNFYSQMQTILPKPLGRIPHGGCLERPWCPLHPRVWMDICSRLWFRRICRCKWPHPRPGACATRNCASWLFCRGNNSTRQKGVPLNMLVKIKLHVEHPATVILPLGQAPWNRDGKDVQASDRFVSRQPTSSHVPSSDYTLKQNRKTGSTPPCC